MSAQESSAYRAAAGVGRFVFGLVAVVVLLGIGFSFWPKIQAAYQQGATQVQPAADTHEIDRLKAQNAAIQAQLNAAQQPRTIVQEVPAGQPPQPVTVNTPPAPPSNEPNAAPAAPPAAPQIVIVHQVSADGAHQTVTGSGGCAVTRVAARCGK